MPDMTTKRMSSPPSKRCAASAPRRAGRTRAEAARTLLVFELSLDVESVLSIVRRHVKLSKEANAAITHELVEMLGRAAVQLRAADHKTATQEDDLVLTTEQAAHLANVSRPYMVKLIDAGEVQLQQKVGNQRRVLRSAVTRWQEDERARQAKVLKRLSKDLDEEIFSS